MPAHTSMPTPSIQRRWKSLPGESAGDAGDPYTGYDRFGRSEAMRWIKPHAGDDGYDMLVDVQWGYSRASQKTWRKDLLAPASAQQDQHFGYDGLHQVTGRTKGLLNVNATAVGGVPAQAEGFGYDETGNWVSYRQQNDGVSGIDETRVSNRSNQVTQVDGSSAGIGYDRNGNMLAVPTGEGLAGPSRRLVWDAWNRLVKVSDADGGAIAEYRYDGNTRRTTMESGDVTRHCYYDDQWRSVEERLDEAATPASQHVWHPADRWELLFRDRSTLSDGALDERLYGLKDQLDPVAVCDASGNVVERFAYTAFGMPTFMDSSFVPQSSSTHDWHFLFHAEFTDTETGWFNYGYRYYVPALGRWVSRDPIGVKGGLNLYEMVGNEPSNLVDLLGMGNEMQNNPNVNAAARSAAIAAADEMRKSGFRRGDGKFDRNLMREFCGWICKPCGGEAKGQLYSTGPVEGRSAGACDPNQVPCYDGDEKVRIYHSHMRDPYPSGDDYGITPPGLGNTIANFDDPYKVPDGKNLKTVDVDKAVNPKTGIPKPEPHVVNPDGSKSPLLSSQFPPGHSLPRRM